MKKKDIIKAANDNQYWDIHRKLIQGLVDDGRLEKLSFTANLYYVSVADGITMCYRKDTVIMIYHDQSTNKVLDFKIFHQNWEDNSKDRSR